MASWPRCPASPPALEHCFGETVSDNDLSQDLSQRDLSAIDDSDLSPDERREMQRRFDDFVNRLRERAGLKAPEETKPKRISRWDPAAASRRH
jgi:hypothetical protein